MKRLEFMSSLPVLLLGAALTLAGGIMYAQAGQSTGAAAIVGSGLTLLGIWVGVEVYRMARRDDDEGAG